MALEYTPFTHEDAHKNRRLMHTRATTLGCHRKGGHWEGPTKGRDSAREERHRAREPHTREDVRKRRAIKCRGQWVLTSGPTTSKCKRAHALQTLPHTHKHMRPLANTYSEPWTLDKASGEKGSASSWSRAERPWWTRLPRIV